MFTFDMRTVAALSALITLVLVLLIRLALHTFPANKQSSLMHWLKGCLFFSAAVGLLMYREQIPPIWSAVVANVLLFAGNAFFSRAVAEFYGRPVQRRWYTLIVTIGAVSSLWFGFLSPHASAEMFFLTLCLVAINALSLRAISNEGFSGLSRNSKAMAFALAAVILFLALRFLAETLLTPEIVAAPLIFAGYLAILPVIGSFIMLLLCAEYAQSQLLHAAHIDHLTKVLNRRALEDIGERALAAARRHEHELSLLILDIDYFKQINDEFGHTVGDEALKTTVARISFQIRKEDQLARIGGEEFVVLLPHTPEREALEIAERIRSGFESAPLLLSPGPREVTVSIGLSTLHMRDEAFSCMLNRADKALYQAKEAGRNRVITAQPMSVEKNLGTQALGALAQ